MVVLIVIVAIACYLKAKKRNQEQMEIAAMTNGINHESIEVNN